MKPCFAVLILLTLTQTINADVWPGDLTIKSQEDIDNFVASNCNIIDGDLIIKVNNVDGLKVIEQVNGSVKISGRKSLENIDGLSNITSIGGDLFITRNERLRSIDNFNNLESIGEDLVIELNNKLHRVNVRNNIQFVYDFFNLL